MRSGLTPSGAIALRSPPIVFRCWENGRLVARTGRHPAVVEDSRERHQAVLPTTRGVGWEWFMARLWQFVHVVRNLARDASDKRRFKGWYSERQNRRGC